MTPSKVREKLGAKPIIDAESDAIVFKGASMSQICTLFKIDSRDAREKLNGTDIKPCGERRGHPIYQIRDVAPYLVAPPYDLDEFIQKMTIADLPTILRKEYWAGMRSRQLYEKEAAELWPTSRVVDMVSSLLKTLRLSLLLSREAVERETELTDRQRAIIARIIDNALEDAHATTTRQFTAAEETDVSAEFHAAEAVGAEDL